MEMRWTRACLLVNNNQSAFRIVWRGSKEGLPRGSAPWESLRTSVLPDLQIQKIPTQCCAVPGYVPRHHFVPFNLTLVSLSSVTGLKDLKDTFQSCAEPIYVPRHHFVVPFNWTSLTFICHFQNLYLILKRIYFLKGYI